MIDALRKTPLLSPLSEAELQRVTSHALQRHLDEGESLFTQGDTATRFYLVVEGQIRLYRLAADGAEKVIEIVAPDQTFAEALMFLSAPRYPVSAAALEPTILIAIDTCSDLQTSAAQPANIAIFSPDSLTISGVPNPHCFANSPD